MGKLTLAGFKQKIVDILIGITTTNLEIIEAQMGTNNITAENETNTALDAPVGSRRTLDLRQRVNKDMILGVFIPGGTFTNGTILKEIGFFFQPTGSGGLAVRDTTNAIFPITITADIDIRADATITSEQG